MFLSDQDVRNLSSKKVAEMYRLHPNDALSVRMWVESNGDSVFYYEETGKLGPGALQAHNDPFVIGIQTPWQNETMLKFGHNSRVAIDATFGTSAKKVDTSMVPPVSPPQPLTARFVLPSPNASIGVESVNATLSIQYVGLVGNRTYPGASGPLPFTSNDLVFRFHCVCSM